MIIFQISKNRKNTNYLLYKNMKNSEILKIEYSLAARRINPPRLGIYFWTLVCP
jgi:hypothetical protein